jgi:phosphoribosylformimino-5-aminoimidazole carboxamide ribotide isomerase
MLVIPEIDLSRGRCVRLTESGYEEEKVYFVEPVLMARLWRVMNAKALHVVDVDAEGRAAGRDNSAVIGDIVRSLDIPVQVGGGVVTAERVRSLLDLGAYRVVLGSGFEGGAAGVGEAVERHGASRVVAGLRAGPDAADRAADLEGRGVRRFVYNDVGDDGTLAGPDLDAYRSLAERLTRARVTAAGGVTGYRDLLALKGIGPPVDSVIVGRALYENRFPCQQFWAWHEKETLDLERFSTAPLADDGR